MSLPRRCAGEVCVLPGEETRRVGGEASTEPDRRFSTTRWTLVQRAGHDPEALVELVRLYDGPLRGWLARRGHKEDGIDEILAGFVATVIVERKLFERANEARGRLRGLLCLALSQYVAERWRNDRKFAGDGQHKGADATDLATPDRAFDRAWAAETIAIAVERCRAECLNGGMEDHWHAFERRVLRPALEGGDPPGLDAIGAELGIEDHTALSSRILTAKRVFRRVLRQTVAATVVAGSAGEVEREERELLALLAS